METIGQRLATARRDRNLSQENMGKEIGVERSTISKWETGKAYPSVEQLLMISQYFNIPISFFFENNHIEEKSDSSTDIIETDTGTQKTNESLLVISLSLMTFVLSPYLFLLGFYCVYVCFKEKLPIYIKIAALVVLYESIGELLFFLYDINIFPSAIIFH